MRCNAKTIDGKACRAHPLSNSGCCLSHNPERKKERARQLGGDLVENVFDDGLIADANV